MKSTTGLRWRLASLLMLAAIQVGTVECRAQTISLEVYERSLAEVQVRVRELSETDTDVASVIDQLRLIRQSIPETDEVAVDGIRLRADNRWIHLEIDSIIDSGTEQSAEEDQVSAGGHLLKSRLDELDFSLGRLRRLISVAPAPASADKAQLERSRLGAILSQPEYRPAEIRESSLRQWLRQAKDYLRRLFGGLLPGSAASSDAGLSDQLTRVQKVALLITVPLSFYALWRLARRYRLRRKVVPLNSDEEVLGLRVSPDHPPAELIEEAKRLAAAGQYREAIRFSFIAAILDLSRKKILTAEPARTNRDYLHALRQREDLLPVFARLTGLFEEFWYGQKEASLEDYANVGQLVSTVCTDQNQE